MTIRILSWNVHGLPYPVTSQRALRMTRIGGRIAAEKPDVAVLQEVWAGSMAPLAAALPGYTMRFVATTFGNASGGIVLVVRDDSRWKVEPGSLLYRTYSRYAPWHRLWEGDGIAGKGAAFVALRHEPTGERLWVVGTHLQSRYRSSEYAQIRRAQIEELRGWLDALDSPALIAGDFNTPSTEKPLYEAIASLGIDLTHEERERTGAVTNFPLHSTAGWIDYVLMRPKRIRLGRSSLELIVNERIDHPYSDHSGLLAEVSMVPCETPGAALD